MTVAEAGREVARACRVVPVQVYREEDLATALLVVAIMPVIVPVAAGFYFSMDRETRDLLDESQEYT